LSRYLALDAEQGKIYLASATTKGSAIKLEKAIVLSDLIAPSPNGRGAASSPDKAGNAHDAGMLTPANASETGKRLKVALSEAGIAPGPVLVTVGRERVVLKEIRYPASVTAAEEPNVIRFQVTKELAESGDHVVIDYFAHPMPEPDGQRRALAFAVRRDLLNAVRTACTAAGLKLVGVTPRPFGVAAALMRAIKDGAVTPPDSPNAPLGILVRGDKWGELVIVRGGQVSFTRSLTAMAVNNETAMLGEIRRNLAVFAGQSAQQAVQALYVAEGDMPGGWSGRLASSLNIPVQSFDPIAGAETEIQPELRGSFSGLVGLVALRARSGELPVNFLAPREPSRTKTDPNKKMLVWVGIAAALVFATVMGLGFFKVTMKANEIEALRAQKKDLENDIAVHADTMKRAGIVKEWENKNVCWLDELYDLTYHFPDPNGPPGSSAEVVKFSGFAIENQSKNATKKYAAAMTLEVNSESQRAVEHLNAAIHDPFRETDATQTKGPAGDRMSRRNLKFEMKARIEHREPSFYLAQLKVAAPTRRDRSRDEFKVEPKTEIKKTEPENDMTGGVGPIGGNP
jgi:Tfp pilus assembly PilM family ATPase